MLSLILCWYDELNNDNRPAIMAPVNRLGGCGLMTQTNTNRLSSLCDSFCQTYLTAAGTRRWPTPASPPSSSPDQSTTGLNNDATQQSTCLLKEVAVMSPGLF